MAQLASLLVPGVNVPQRDTSWLDGIFKSLGGAVDQFAENKAFNGLADRLGSSGGTQAASLTTQPSGQSVAGIAPVTPVDRGPMQGDTYQPFIDTVKGRVTNPYGLSAVAATGRAESGWSGANAGRTWSDPSQSGQAGTSGGILSWRGPRLASLQAYAKSKGENGNGSPSTQAEFFLQENPQLIDQLNNAKSSDEAAGIMANAWKFAGYDQQGGEAARRRALAQNYYSNEFGRGNAGTAAIEAAAPGSGSIGGGFDAGRFASGEVAQGVDGLASAMTAQPYVDPVVSSQGSQPMPTSGAPVSTGQPTQAASSAGNLIAAGVTPVQRGGVDPATIQYMLRSPQLRGAGLKLWAANAGKADTAEPWQFVTLHDGTLARANQQTGEVMSLGQFAKSASQDLPSSYREYQLAKQDGFKGGYADWEKVKQPGVTSVVNNPGAETAADKAAGEGLGKIFSGIFQQGQDARSDQANIALLRSSLANSPTGLLGALAGKASDFGINVGTNADQVQVAKSIIAKLVPAQRVPGSGTTSDRDLAMFQDALPRLSGTAEGNQIILDTMQGLAEFKRQQAEIVGRYYAGDLKAGDAVKELQALPDPFAGFKRLQDSVGGETQTQSQPRRARNPQTGETLELRNGQWVKVQ